MGNESMAMTLLGAAAIGMSVGGLTGVFGVGGGFLMTPALMILLGVSGPIAVGTDLATILVNSTVGMIRRKGSNTVDIKLGLVIASGSVLGVLAGSHLLEMMKHLPRIVVRNRELDVLEYILLWLFLCLLSGIAAYLYYDYHKNGGAAPAKRVGLFSRIKIPPYMVFSTLEEPRLAMLPLLLLGFVLGLLTGLMGIGGGVILLPALVYLVGQRTPIAAGTSLMLVWVSSSIGVCHKVFTGDVNLLLLAALLAGSIPGTLLGTRLGLKLPGPKIRIYFVYVVAGVIVMIAAKLYYLTCVRN